ncbi:MAG: Na+/H+ antiporter NhaC family protein [Gammaproteobacteria bacterium]
MKNFFRLQKVIAMEHLLDKGLEWYAHIQPYSKTWLTLVPALLSISLAFLTRQVIFALFVGVIAGAIILCMQTGSMMDINFLRTFLLPSLGTADYALILITYLWCLGGLIGMWNKTGAARHFAETVGHRLAYGPRSAKVFAWVMGLVFHQGGTVSTILTGTTVRPVTDKYKVSHEELAYIVDSTASPVATILPFNAWPIYVGGIIIATGQLPFVTTEAEAFSLFISSIPFNFYALLAVFFTLLMSIEKLPWMGAGLRAAMVRSRTTGKLDADDSQPMMKLGSGKAHQAYGYLPSNWDFLLPLILLLALAITPYVCAHLGLIDRKYSNFIPEAFLLAVLTSMVVAKVRGMSLSDVMNGFNEGCQSVTVAAILLGLAVTLGVVTKKLGLAPFLITLTDGSLSPTLLPGLLTLLCLLIAFATGSSFGTFAVVLPVAIPLAYQLVPEVIYVQICLGAVLGGSVAGDQCSPVSDTVVLSSMSTGCDLMHHVKTQLPLSMTLLGVAAVFSMIAVQIWV